MDAATLPPPDEREEALLSRYEPEVRDWIRSVAARAYHPRRPGRAIIRRAAHIFRNERQEVGFIFEAAAILSIVVSLLKIWRMWRESKDDDNIEAYCKMASYDILREDEEIGGRS